MWQNSWQHHSVRWTILDAYAQRTSRCCRPDYPMELSIVDVVLEMGSSNRHWMHQRLETSRANATVSIVRLCFICRSRFPCRCVERRARLWPNCWPCNCCTSRNQKGCLHRFSWCRTINLRDSRPLELEKSIVRIGRQEPIGHSWRCKRRWGSWNCTQRNFR